MQPLDPVVNAKSSLSAALQRFEALTTADQLSILTFVLGWGVGADRLAKATRQTSDELGAEAIKDKQPPDHDSKTVVVQPQPETEQHGGNHLRELAAAAQIQIFEYDVLAEHSKSEGSSRPKGRAALSVGFANQPAKNSQSFWIALTMTVSFLLTIGISLYQRKTTPLATREPEMTAIAPALAPAPPAQPLPQEPQTIAPAPAPMPVEPLWSAATISAIPDGDRPQPPLPQAPQTGEQ